LGDGARQLLRGNRESQAGWRDNHQEGRYTFKVIAVGLKFSQFNQDLCVSERQKSGHIF
jgi:hypothetical protein